MALGDYLKAERLIKLPWFKKALILGLGALIIIILYFTTLDRKYQNQISGLKDSIAKLDKQTADLKTVERDLPKFERQNALLNKKLEKAKTKLPGKSQMDALLKEVTARAKDNNIDIRTFEKKSEAPKSLYVEVPVDIKMKAGFFQSMIFLDELARLERIVNVTNLGLKADKLGNLDISFTLNAYRFKEPAEEAPETTKKAKPAVKLPTEEK